MNYFPMFFLNFIMLLTLPGDHITFIYVYVYICTYVCMCIYLKNLQALNIIICAETLLHWHFCFSLQESTAYFTFSISFLLFFCKMSIQVLSPVSSKGINPLTKTLYGFIISSFNLLIIYPLSLESKIIYCFHQFSRDRTPNLIPCPYY